MSELDDIALARKMNRAMKPSRIWRPLVFQTTRPDKAQVWANEIYVVTRRSYKQGWFFGGGPWMQLGVHSIDGSARHDWRDLQNIKNDMAGPEWEAIELFPSESRLMDPSNYFILWCAPCIPVGMNNGRVIMSKTAIAPQRPWKVSPHDCDTPEAAGPTATVAT